MVEAARDAGWEAIGTDLNPSAVEFGRGRGLDLRPVALEDGGFADRSFDAVSLFDVLEHLHDPRKTLDACVRLLRPGGIVFLYVPNYDSASRLLMGADAHFIWPTHHLNYYTPATMQDLLARAGPRDRVCGHRGPGHRRLPLVPAARCTGPRDAGVDAIADRLQFFINAGAYGKNLRVIGRTPR